MVFAAPTKLAPNHTRRPSVSAIVNSAPTLGPSMAYMPPAIAANTICSDTPIPDTVSGLRYIKYCPNTAPPRAVSAALTALGGAVFGQYLMYLNPETVSGIGVSLQIVFAAIAGGMYAMLGPSVGALLTIALNEGLRVWFGANFVGAANTIYGILLILFVIFMPRGILGWVEAARRPRARAIAPT